MIRIFSQETESNGYLFYIVVFKENFKYHDR